ncbi:hypothetical protein C8F01DRAFT_1085029 [Mycena amicta]|nr:hypothetical protein C8F01DRAFT_1085029 [Mycena amicta]
MSTSSPASCASAERPPSSADVRVNVGTEVPGASGTPLEPDSSPSSSWVLGGESGLEAEASHGRTVTLLILRKNLPCETVRIRVFIETWRGGDACWLVIVSRILGIWRTCTVLRSRHHWQLKDSRSSVVIRQAPALNVGFIVEQDGDGGRRVLAGWLACNTEQNLPFPAPYAPSETPSFRRPSFARLQANEMNDPLPRNEMKASRSAIVIGTRDSRLRAVRTRGGVERPTVGVGRREKKGGRRKEEEGSEATATSTTYYTACSTRDGDDNRRPARPAVEKKQKKDNEKNWKKFKDPDTLYPRSSGDP